MWIQCFGFDTDGVIVAADALHFKAFNMTLKKRGLPQIDKEKYYDKYLASDDKNFFLGYLGEIRQKTPEPKEIVSFVEEKSKIFDNLMIKSPPKFYPGVIDLIKKMKKSGIRLFDVTGSLKKEVAAHLKRGGIENCFEFVISAEDVTKSKPDAEAYLKALKMLNSTPTSKVKPYNCIITEDSPEGVVSAKTAGFYTIGVTNTTKEEELWNAGADLVFDKLDINIYSRLRQMEKRPSSRLELLDLFSDFLPN